MLCRFAGDDVDDFGARQPRDVDRSDPQEKLFGATAAVCYVELGRPSVERPLDRGTQIGPQLVETIDRRSFRAPDCTRNQQVLALGYESRVKAARVVALAGRLQHVER